MAENVLQRQGGTPSFHKMQKNSRIRTDVATFLQQKLRCIHLFFAIKIMMQKKTSYTRQGNSTVPNGQVVLNTAVFNATYHSVWSNSKITNFEFTINFSNLLPKPSYRKVRPNSEPLKPLLKRPEVRYNTNKVSENSIYDSGLKYEKSTIQRSRKY